MKSKENIGKSLHTNKPTWRVIVYNSRKTGVMTDVSFEDANAAKNYYDLAIFHGYPTNLFELCQENYPQDS